MTRQNETSETVGTGRARARIVHQRPIKWETVDGVEVPIEWITLGDEESDNVVPTVGRDFMHVQCYASSGIGANGFNYIALSNDALTETTASTTLSTEIAANGLTRAQASSISHTNGTNTTTLSRTFTASGTQSAQKAALFTASSSGTMNHALAFTQRNLISGDTLAVTFTITLG